MKIFKIYFVTLLTLILFTACSENNENMPSNIVWNGVSENEAGSMPFGNGVVGGNVWAEKDCMKLYLSRGDCFSELGRLLKVGRLKLSIGNSSWDENFTQTLDFASGRIILKNSFATLTVMADINNPVIWIHGRLNNPEMVYIVPEIWRNKPTDPKTTNEEHSMYSARVFTDIPFMESADVKLVNEGFIGFCHHNDSSVFRMTLDNNGLTGAGVEDPYTNRTFGAILTSNELKTTGDSLKSYKPIDEFTIKVAVTSYSDFPINKWQEKTLACLKNSGTLKEAEARTENYWRELWNRSYIQVETPDTITGKRITEAYDCQRWITASAGLSDFPIKYNGSIFTLSDKFISGEEGKSPDYRRWGEPYWWQNTRLPYYPLVKCGDWTTLKKLFCFFEKLMPVFKEQARVYHSASGATFPETMTQFGTFAAFDFGLREKDDTSAYFPKSMYIRRIMQCSLDLVHLMNDYVHYSGDMEFLNNDAIPMAEEFLEFFIDRNKPDSTGKMRIKNTQSLETYWYGVENDAPTIAGLHAVVRDFRTLPKDFKLPESLESKLSYLEKVLPELPLEKDSLGLEIYSPAEKYNPSRCNCESPELMAIFPFRLSTIVENKEIGIETFKMRKEHFLHGWPQFGQQAAILGLTDEAKEQLINKIDNTHPSFKFPSYYGPNFDWVPDQCHGGNLMTTLQEMVMQSYNCEVYLLPAFPKDWNVRFRMACGNQDYVSGEYSSGQWVEYPSTDKKGTVIHLQ